MCNLFCKNDLVHTTEILFSLFINDLAKEIKAAGYGISVGNDKVPILLYADDIVLLSESEDDMQNMLDIVYII